jgi:hypothetical protein
VYEEIHAELGAVLEGRESESSVEQSPAHDPANPDGPDVD